MPEGSSQTIVMLQKTSARQTKTWTDHESLKGAVQYLIDIYKNGMAKRNPGQAVSGAGVSKFLDKLYDVVLLVYEPSLEAFVARDVAWIKKRVEVLLADTDTYKEARTL